MARVFDVSFKIGASMAASFAGAMRGASNALGEVNRSMANISRQQGANKRVLELRQSLANSAREFNAAKQRAAELAASIARSSNPTAKMIRDHERAQAAVKRARDAMKAQAGALRTATTEAGAAGKSTAALVREQERLAQSGNRAAKAQESLQRNLSAQQSNLARRSELRGQMIDTVAVTAPVVAMVKQAIDWEQSLAEFNKVADLNHLELSKRSREIQDLAIETGVAAEELAAAYTSAALGGLDQSEWNKFAVTSAKMGVAIDVTGGEAGGFLMKWQSGMGLSLDQAIDLADVVNHLGNNMKSVESAALAGVLQRQGAVLQAGGFDATSAAATMAAMLSSGAPEEVAATAAKNFSLALNAGFAATKTQKDVFDQLGFYDTERIARAMQVAPQETIMQVMEAIRNQPEFKQGAIIQTLFGKESIGSITPLIQNTELLAQAYGLVGDKTKYAGSLENEYAAMSQTTQQQFKKLSQAIKVASTNIGATLLPILNDIVQSITPLIASFSTFIGENQTLVKYVMLTVAALVAVKVAAVAGGYAFTFIRGAFLTVQGTLLAGRAAWILYTGAINTNTRAGRLAAAMSKVLAGAKWLLNAALAAGKWVWATAQMLLYKSAQLAVFIATKAFTAAQLLFNAALVGGRWAWVIAQLAAYKAAQIAATVITKSITAAQWLFNVALTANPIGLVIAAIAGLIAAGVALYKNWDAVVAFFGAAWDKIKGFFLSFSPVAWIVDGITAMIDHLKNIDLFESGKAILGTLASGMKAMASAPIESIKGIFSKVREYLPFSDAKIGPLSELTASGAAIMSTLADGMTADAAAPELALNSALGGVQGGIGGFADRANNAAPASSQTFTITQEIHVNDGANFEQIRQAASAGAQDLIRDLKAALQREERLSYG